MANKGSALLAAISSDPKEAQILESDENGL